MELLGIVLGTVFMIAGGVQLARWTFDAWLWLRGHRRVVLHQPPLVIDYTNHYGDRGLRTVWPMRLWWGESEWHEGEQLLMDAWDAEKDAMRTFAVKDIHGWRPAPKG